MEYTEYKKPIKYYNEIKELVLKIEEDAHKSLTRGEKQAGMDFRRSLRHLKKLVKAAVTESLKTSGPANWKVPI